MAKIARLPSYSIIRGFKGTLDFYVWKGINCVRSWPRSPGHDRTPAVQEGWQPFTWAAQNWQNLDTETQEAFKRMAAGTRFSGRDMFTKSYLSRDHLPGLPE